MTVGGVTVAGGARSIHIPLWLVGVLLNANFVCEPLRGLDSSLRWNDRVVSGRLARGRLGGDGKGMAGMVRPTLVR